jgi:2-polyprenyl-3-methyl-5-hydroxy-6-metoxy-1,4-benzoquinol methylase
MPFVPHEIEWTAEKSKRLWDYYGSNPKYAGNFFGFMAGKLVAKRLFSTISMPDNARLLDFSCGPGDVIAACIPLMQSSQEIYATDFSDTYVLQVSDRFKNESRFKGSVLTQSLPTPYPDGFFDVVFATEVVEHLLDSELDGMLAECRRLLKPGGKIFLTTPNNEDYDASKILCPECGCTFHRWQHVRVWTAATLAARVESARFITRVVQPIAWQRWLGKLRSLVVNRRIIRGGLVYMGERAP